MLALPENSTRQGLPQPVNPSRVLVNLRLECELFSWLGSWGAVDVGAGIEVALHVVTEGEHFLQQFPQWHSPLHLAFAFQVLVGVFHAGALQNADVTHQLLGVAEYPFKLLGSGLATGTRLLPVRPVYQLGEGVEDVCIECVCVERV